MKNVLIPTDFSENAWNAIKYAMHLLEDEQCTFHFLHTYTPTAYAYDFNSNLGYVGAGSIETENDRIYRASQDGLKEILEKIERHYHNYNHDYEVVSAYNVLSDEVNELIERRGIDLVIMGKKGHKGAEEVLFGSNTLHVMRTAKCPVLTIPEDFHFRYIDDILFPSDYRHPYSKSEVYPIVEMAKLNEATVHTLHINNEPELSKEQQNNRDTINAYFARIKHDFREVADAGVSKTIASYIEEHQIDMLAMTRRKHSFLERLLFKQSLNTIGRHLSIPFLVLPVK